MRSLWIVVLLLCVGCFFQITAEEKVSEPISQQNKSKNGIVTGKVTFGPLRPGPERLDEDSQETTEVAQKMYEAHRVAVLSENGKETLKKVEINKDGIYKVELPPGKYQLQIIPPGMGRFQKQTVSVTVKEGKTEEVDISIDTGIR